MKINAKVVMLGLMLSCAGFSAPLNAAWYPRLAGTLALWGKEKAVNGYNWLTTKQNWLDFKANHPHYTKAAAATATIAVLGASYLAYKKINNKKSASKSKQD